MRHARISMLAAGLLLGPSALGLAAQEASDPELRGHVVSAETGEPIAGAWIAMEGYGRGTYSRRGGEFRLPDVPAATRRYDVAALGYVATVVTLEAGAGEHVVELTPDPEVWPGVSATLAHLEDRRNGGRVFDRETLAFSGAFDLAELMEMRGVRSVRRLCMNERSAPGLTTMVPNAFYLVEVQGGTVRAYTQDFLEQIARESADRLSEILRPVQPRC